MPPKVGTAGWLETGKPVVTGLAENGLDVSLSHDKDVCVAVVGNAPAGLDIQSAERRTPEEWFALLGEQKSKLLRRLMDMGGPDVDMARAGTRIWSAVEAAQKATGNVEVGIDLLAVSEDSVVFQTTNLEVPLRIITFPVRLTRGPERIVASVLATSAPVPSARKTELSTDDYSGIHLFDIDRSGPRDRLTLVYRFPVTYQDLKTLGQTANFATFFQWTGKVRELSTWPLYADLARFFAPGTHAAITNYSKFKLFGEIRLDDKLEVRMWMGTINPTTFNLIYDWRRMLPDGSAERVARTELGITFAEVKGHGQLTPCPFPKFFADYIYQMNPLRAEGSDEPAPLPSPLENLSAGNSHFEKPRGPTTGPLLAEYTVLTGLEDSNIVGNVYYANFAVWQARLRDSYIHSLCPELYSTRRAEPLCVDATLEFLRDAMPFDQVLVRMTLESLNQRGFELRFDYFRSTNEQREKLATSMHRAVWVERENGVPKAAPLPETLHHDLNARIAKWKAGGDKL